MNKFEFVVLALLLLNKLGVLVAVPKDGVELDTNIEAVVFGAPKALDEVVFPKIG